MKYIYTVVFLLGMVQAAYCLTPEEIILLRQHGVTDSTIQLMIKSEKANPPDSELPQDRESSPSIQEVQKPDGKATVIYSTGKAKKSDLTRGEKEKVDRAWEMLNNLSLEFEK